MKKAGKWSIITKWIIILVISSFLINTACGYLFFQDVIEKALGFGLPSGFKLVQYWYFAGKFKATISYPEAIVFEQIYDEIRSRDLDFYVEDFDENTINLMDVDCLKKKEAIKATKFVAQCSHGYYSFCWGVLFYTKDETMLYISEYE